MTDNEIAERPTEAEPETRCRRCDGNGCEYGCGWCRSAYLGPNSHRICGACSGRGVAS